VDVCPLVVLVLQLYVLKALVEPDRRYDFSEYNFDN
jgi:hypothetical protein